MQLSAASALDSLRGTFPPAAPRAVGRDPHLTTLHRYLGIAALALALAPVGEAAPVLLRYKATPGSLRFRFTGYDQVIHEGGDAGKTEHRYRLVEAFERTRAKLGEERLVALSTTLEKALAIDGKLAPVKFTSSPRLERFDPRGRSLDSRRGHSPGEALQVVFPEAPIEPGHTWVDTIPAAKGFPSPVEVTREFVGVRRVGGQDAAVIRSHAEAEADLPGAGGTIQFRLQSKLVLGLDDGELVRVQTDAQTHTHRDAPTPGGVTSIQRRSRKVLERVRGR